MIHFFFQFAIKVQYNSACKLILIQLHAYVITVNNIIYSAKLFYSLNKYDYFIIMLRTVD